MLLHRALGPVLMYLCGLRRQFRFQRTSDILRNLALNAEDVLQFAIVRFRPKIGIVLRIDELHDDANAVAGFLHAAFQHRGHTQFRCNLAQIFGRLLYFAVEVREITFRSLILKGWYRMSS